MSLYRKVVWYAKGLKEFTKQGYEAAAKSFSPSDLDVDVTGQSFMITGANSGLGKCAALDIAKRGGTVHMVCRNEERAEQAKQEIIAASGNQNVHVHILDMSQPRKVFAFAKEFQASGQQLNVLVNNAGCMIHERTLDADGLESNFATNTLGTHILTVGLIPLLSRQTGEKPRVITVSSGGMYVQKLDPKDLSFEHMRPFDGTMAYAQNKRQQVIMTEEYAKIYPNIQFSSMHPGWADTPAVQSAMPEFRAKMEGKLRTVEEGADTITWLAISKAALQQTSGAFFQDRKAVNTHLPLAWSKSSKEDRALLMKTLDELTKKFSS
ncbi:dehydrogenase/reductase SDR family member 12 [Lingula anatina]|uniref:Dehydrogenase/reductase SDR family member 12 n=1 Tax=Lingula anatina TaxID=7574 RepID=A0A1S3HID4_LINAN|nr:dehydrogenase/reductase SDR family member 12 [Lingula anatina]XP_013385880.1 dehydrogenase/reductase SDR family member 12 [Lingula anatina]|eukprot:XP_013385879.1 dehydrogenase/reductase SDR family member 12 [Lingula anatina]